MDLEKEIKTQLVESSDLKLKLASEFVSEIKEIALVLIECVKKGGKILLCGNGGSAADSQHLATELVTRLRLERKPIRAIALTTDTSLMTAMANDYDFSRIFERQVEALGDKDDVLIGITTSGNSGNVIKALEMGKRIGMKTVAITGKDGGKIRDVADISLIVPSMDVQRIQEAHITVGHILCDILEKYFYGN
ncbi:MAG: phosphoheptose isomerase [Candidatus Neomarinimicrobiota bacterium]|nr:D-sedoheptulose 7-phosphate isomerase [Candidatus Neomarinimicrobiota bacterium]RKY49063.1 MAG: phosphoheptose isomerase [Candidatus Neomarinimicrobiota bacterium]RKY53822.1 MAG: phosphoheptose isomerase [Candidatus Neomarinimicrobiota bacterium]HDN59778.1 SIS domain-containing protein [Candidatus Neomarinimicrobiota bacterium]